MITRIDYLRGMGVFGAFDWNSSVKAKNGVVVDFKKINVVYGRNYSGKTTISRVFRSLEKCTLPEGYSAPEFQVSTTDGQTVTHNDLLTHNISVRVFNEDFVRENLQFIFNPEKDLKSFAILGSNNALVEQEIRRLTTEIGSAVIGKESGLHLEYLEKIQEYEKVQANSNLAKNQLDEKLRTKALDRNIGIKYKPERFGDQNYSTTKLSFELDQVAATDYVRPSDAQLLELENILKETPKQAGKVMKSPNLNFVSLCLTAKNLLERKIADSGKIEELVKDAVLNRWVSEGRTLHKGRRTNCAFCGQTITANRWIELENHYDKASEQLEDEINKCIDSLTAEEKVVSSAFLPNITDFYFEFHTRITELTLGYKEASSVYSTGIAAVVDQLTLRKNNILSPVNFSFPTDPTTSLLSFFSQYESIQLEAEIYTKNLKQRQDDARQALRLREVSDFAVTISYQEEKRKINDLLMLANSELQNRNGCHTAIQAKEEELSTKKRERNDEEAGAKKVNKYLKEFFGHEFLSLESITNDDEPLETGKNVRFQIVRDGKRAHHLSEGECSLVAFCYFIAKLSDVETLGKKPIIWIDDPISSLDANHIYFLYSLVKAEIVELGLFEQLFLSTHNLEFLKFLKRLNGGVLGGNGKFISYEKAFLLISRHDRVSQIVVMPKYLQEFVTEFNYLFGQIYQCSQIEKISDKNYTVFYNFGNNARKFLEIYLYYRFPDNTAEIDKLKTFFAAESIPAILTDRINNEYSHLAAAFERGSIPVDAPEMKNTASTIIRRIREIDESQYNALVASVLSKEQ